MPIDISGEYPIEFEFEKRLLNNYGWFLDNKDKFNDIPELFKDPTEFCRRLGKELVNSKSKSEYKSLCDQELIDYMFTFHQREQFFQEGWNRWTNEFSNGGYDDYYNPVNLFYWYSSVYVQQIEGPFRYNMAAVYDMVMTLSGSKKSWKDILYNDNGKNRFHNIVNTIQQIEDRYIDTEFGEGFKAGICMLDGMELLHEGELYQQQRDITEIRNSIAHSDYIIQRNSEGRIFIDFGQDGDVTKIYLEDFLDDIFRHMFLMHGISIGVSSSLACIAREFDESGLVKDITNSFELINVEK